MLYKWGIGKEKGLADNDKSPVVSSNSFLFVDDVGKEYGAEAKQRNDDKCHERIFCKIIAALYCS